MRLLFQSTYAYGHVKLNCYVIRSPASEMTYTVLSGALNSTATTDSLSIAIPVKGKNSPYSITERIRS